MRWTAANIFHNVNHFLGAGHREEGATIIERTEEIRLAMLDCLAEGRLDWADLVRRTAIAARGEGGELSVDDLATMAADVRLLWRHSLLSPLYNMMDA